MTVNAEINGVPATLEVLPGGSIRVTHESGAFNAMHAPASDGEVMYVVHPMQRHQYAYLLERIPADQRPREIAGSERPWWSYASTRAGADRESDG